MGDLPDSGFRHLDLETCPSAIRLTLSVKYFIAIFLTRCFHVFNDAPNLRYRLQCRKHCPLKTYEDNGRKMCMTCPLWCRECHNETHCSSCQSGYYLHGKKGEL